MKAKEKAPRMLPHPIGASPAGCADVCHSHSHLTQNCTSCQTGVLPVFSEVDELKERFSPKHSASVLLGLVFDSLARMSKENAILYGRKGERVIKCGDFLQFAHEIGFDGTTSGKGKLFKAEFCRERLCPMCAWRRSLKIFGQVSQIMDLIADRYKFLMLTLTVPNVSGNDLETTIKHMMKSFNRLTKYKAFQGVVLGFFRALEVTRNQADGSFHPHFHVVLAVSHDYGHKGGKYLNHDDWLSLWRKACKDDSIMIVDVRRIKGKAKEGVNAQNDLKAAVAEVAKYTVKDVDYLDSDDVGKSCEVVDTLYRALHGVRLCHFGGVFRDAYRQLHLQDAEAEFANLIDVGEDKIRQDVALLIVQYDWRIGAYVKGKSWTREHPVQDKRTMSA